jgi:hypothetical protein
MLGPRLEELEINIGTMEERDMQKMTWDIQTWKTNLSMQAEDYNVGY